MKHNCMQFSSPVILVPERQGEEDQHKFEVSLGYTVISRTARAMLNAPRRGGRVCFQNSTEDLHSDLRAGLQLPLSAFLLYS